MPDSRLPQARVLTSWQPTTRLSLGVELPGHSAGLLHPGIRLLPSPMQPELSVLTVTTADMQQGPTIGNQLIPAPLLPTIRQLTCLSGEQRPLLPSLLFLTSIAGHRLPRFRQLQQI